MQLNENKQKSRESNVFTKQLISREKFGEREFLDVTHCVTESMNISLTEWKIRKIKITNILPLCKRHVEYKLRSNLPCNQSINKCLLLPYHKIIYHNHHRKRKTVKPTLHRFIS